MNCLFTDLALTVTGTQEQLDAGFSTLHQFGAVRDWPDDLGAMSDRWRMCDQAAGVNRKGQKHLVLCKIFVGDMGLLIQAVRRIAYAVPDLEMDLFLQGINKDTLEPVVIKFTRNRPGAGWVGEPNGWTMQDIPGGV